jgi:diguanylate cyclase (GGDEF)-like protein/PAS domain S-box-containing protein
MVGCTRQQLGGLSRDRITRPDDVGGDAAALRVLLAGDASSHRREKRYLHASGRVIWAQIDVTLIHDSDGQPVRFIAQVQDISERRTYERRIAYMADHDALTGLLNRRGLERELHSHWARVNRYGATGAVLMLNLDHFKDFNDTHGHAGNELIVRITQALETRLRDSDVFARPGGDEFAVLVPGGGERETQTVAEALLEVVRDEALPPLDEGVAPVIGAGRRVTVSIGIARFEGGERLTAEQIMANADLAMYDAKDAGGDRWAGYRTEQHPRPRTESRMRWAAEIDAAIAHDGFELLAQPIVSLAGTTIRQYELLRRMRDRGGDVIQPGSFVYIAERLGLIAEIDRWVVERAIGKLAEQRALGRDLRLEVNLSARTIGDERLTELIERRLRETGVPPTG